MYIINTSDGIVYRDKDGEYWKGGSNALVKPALFTTRKSAKKICDMIRNKWKRKPYACNWYDVLKCWDDKED